MLICLSPFMQRVLANVTRIKNESLILFDGNFVAALAITHADLAFGDGDFHGIRVGAGHTESSGMRERDGVLFYRDVKIAAVMFSALEYCLTLVQVDSRVGRVRSW